LIQRNALRPPIAKREFIGTSKILCGQSVRPPPPVPATGRASVDNPKIRQVAALARHYA
jgi:hypothetical protein